jgi:hypothetical protein
MSVKNKNVSKRDPNELEDSARQIIAVYLALNLGNNSSSTRALPEKWECFAM